MQTCGIDLSGKLRSVSAVKALQEGTGKRPMRAACQSLLRKAPIFSYTIRAQPAAVTQSQTRYLLSRPWWRVTSFKALSSVSSAFTRQQSLQATMPPNGERSVMTVAAPAKEEKKAEKDGPKTIFLKDYKAPSYKFKKVDLTFKLGEETTLVTSRITVQPVEAGAPFALDGVNLKLATIKFDGQDVPASEYEVSPKKLILKSPPSKPFQLEIVTEIQPQKNTSLEGLYKSSGNFCTQCEAEGFRKITYFQDRPDVMSIYTTRIEADKAKYPVLLGNGNLVDQGDLENGQHFCVWEDPFLKPCYLFALVAGQLVSLEDTFTTKSGRQVDLKIWVQEHNKDKTEHAMRSLKAAMKWDEDVFGLEYDLDLFNIVAVDDFNMGAMENKSLNIFNSRLVLATPETATDADYSAIEGVIGHEYFHNWTGNRVTCRDWFQLSLKEGLTVFRDQEFSADMNSRAVKRISDVQRLRASQFSQDAGPMAHPVRPDSYIKMDNFYTVTVYEKGAEVVRMYQTLLGKEGFRKGMDLYFERHDGQAVTCDDFLAAMRDANSAEVANFATWYRQAGTPVLTVKSHYDEAAKTFTLHCKQVVPPTPGQPSKEPMLLPLAVGLLGKDGSDLPLTKYYDGETLHEVATNGTAPTTVVLRVTKEEHTFKFADVAVKPVPSLLRDFSAPVRLVANVSEDDLLFLLANDSDQFNRWEAAQTLARNLMLGLVKKQQEGQELSVPDKMIDALRSLLTDKSLDKAFVARTLSLPGESELADLMEIADPDAIHSVHKFVTKTIARSLKAELLEAVNSNRSTEGYSPDTKSKARRSLKNISAVYLASLNEPEVTEMLLKDFKAASNMTDQIAALAALCMNPGEARETALNQFYEQWKHDNLVVNKWLGLQAMSNLPGNVERVKKLMQHEAYDMKNPNKNYALIGGFCGSPLNFHAADGSGYQFLAEAVLQLDKINAQVASRMVSAFTRWRKYDEKRQALAKAQLERIVAMEGLSDNVYEIASKSLDV